MEERIKIGDVVIACGWVSCLLEYSEQRKRTGNPMLIDTNWVPSRWSWGRPDPKDRGVLLFIGDELTVMSEEVYPPEGYHSYLYKVKDKAGHQFYLSCEYIKPRSKQLSLPFNQ